MDGQWIVVKAWLSDFETSGEGGEKRKDFGSLMVYFISFSKF